MVSMLNLWWTCSIYGEHAQLMVSMVNLEGLFDCQNSSSGSKDIVILIFKSADLYSHSWLGITIRLSLKNYPKMTLWLSKSIQQIKRYSDIDFKVSWFVQSQVIWHHNYIGLEKLPQNDSLNVKIHSLVQKLWLCYDCL